MCFCGDKTIDGENLLAQLRDFKNKDVEVRIHEKNYCTFHAVEGKWSTNFQNLPSHEHDAIKLRVSELQKKLNEKEKEIDELERKYLTKIAKLLILTQVHCDIKTDINSQFDELGVSVKYIQRDRVEEISNKEDMSHNQSFGMEKEIV